MSGTVEVKVEYRRSFNKMYITRGDKLFEVKVTSEGITIDVYSTDDHEFVGSPFSATYEEMEFEADVHAVLNHVNQGMAQSNKTHSL